MHKRMHMHVFKHNDAHVVIHASLFLSHFPFTFLVLVRFFFSLGRHHFFDLLHKFDLSSQVFKPTQRQKMCVGKRNALAGQIMKLSLNINEATCLHLVSVRSHGQKIVCLKCKSDQRAYTSKTKSSLNRKLGSMVVRWRGRFAISAFKGEKISTRIHDGGTSSQKSVIHDGFSASLARGSHCVPSGKTQRYTLCHRFIQT